VPCREHTSKALRYGTRSQGISQFYLHTPRSSAKGMNDHTCLFFPSWSWYSHFTVLCRDWVIQAANWACFDYG